MFQLLHIQDEKLLFAKKIKKNKKNLIWVLLFFPNNILPTFFQGQIREA
jgi:hypothetical protein